MLRVLVLIIAAPIAACEVCKTAGDACCSESRCDKGLVCSHNTCVESASTGSLGQGCSSCDTGLCLDTDADGGFPVCTIACNTSDDCLAGWACGEIPGHAGKACRCLRSTDVCDKKDNDCDGVVDGVSAQASCEISEGLGSACGDGSCTCLGTRCGSACVELDTDPLNCGGCGQVCPGADGGMGVCSAGRCTELEILEDDAARALFGIAADGTDVFWSDGQKMCQTSFATGLCTYFVEEAPGQITIAGDVIFWTVTGGLIHSRPLGGGAITTYPAANALLFAVGRDRLFWEEDRAIYSALLAGGEATQLATTLQDARGNPYEFSPLALTVDDTNVYWLEVQGTLRSVPITGGPATTLVEHIRTSPYTRLAADGENIYWTAGGYGLSWTLPLPMSPAQVMKVARTGGTPVTLYDSAPRIVLFGELLLDGADLYWTTLEISGTRSGILRMPRTGGKVQGVVSEPFTLSFSPGVTDFALDPGGVDYLSVQAQVRRVRR